MPGVGWAGVPAGWVTPGSSPTPPNTPHPLLPCPVTPSAGPAPLKIPFFLPGRPVPSHFSIPTPSRLPTTLTSQEGHTPYHLTPVGPFQHPSCPPPKPRPLSATPQSPFLPLPLISPSRPSPSQSPLGIPPHPLTPTRAYKAHSSHIW